MEINREISKVMSQLPPMIDDFVIDSEHYTFSSGDYYIQHIPHIIDKAQREFLDICYQITGSKIYLSETMPAPLRRPLAFVGGTHRQGIIGRYLDDSGDNRLYKNWYRFMCIDEHYREWGQPYFAINLNEQERAKSKSPLNLLLPELRDYFLVYQRDEKIKEVLK